MRAGLASLVTAALRKSSYLTITRRFLPRSAGTEFCQLGRIHARTVSHIRQNHLPRVRSNPEVAASRCCPQPTSAATAVGYTRTMLARALRGLGVAHAALARAVGPLAPVRAMPRRAGFPGLLQRGAQALPGCRPAKNMYLHTMQVRRAMCQPRQRRAYTGLRWYGGDEAREGSVVVMRSVGG